MTSTLVALLCSAAGTTVGLVGLVVVTGRRRVICGAAVTFGLVLAWWLAWTLL